METSQLISSFKMFNPQHVSNHGTSLKKSVFLGWKFSVYMNRICWQELAATAFKGLRVVIDRSDGKLANCFNDLEHTVRQKAFDGLGFVSHFFNIFKASESLMWRISLDPLPVCSLCSVEGWMLRIRWRSKFTRNGKSGIWLWSPLI